MFPSVFLTLWPACYAVFGYGAGELRIPLSSLSPSLFTAEWQWEVFRDWQQGYETWRSGEQGLWSVRTYDFGVWQQRALKTGGLGVWQQTLWSSRLEPWSVTAGTVLRKNSWPWSMTTRALECDNRGPCMRTGIFGEEQNQVAFETANREALDCEVDLEICKERVNI